MIIRKTVERDQRGSFAAPASSSIRPPCRHCRFDRRVTRRSSAGGAASVSRARWPCRSWLLAGGGLELLEHGLVVGTDPFRRDATLVIEGVDVG